MIILYSKDGCPACSGNTSVSRMWAQCDKREVAHQSRISVLWEVWGKEAAKLEELYEIKQPFFYSTNAEEVLMASTFTDTDAIIKLVKKDKENENTEM